MPRTLTQQQSKEAAMPGFFTVETLAKRWGVSRHPIDQMIAQGELPHFRVGKLIRIPEKFIEEYEQCSHSDSNSTGECGAPSEQKMAKRGAFRSELTVVTLPNRD